MLLSKATATRDLTDLVEQWKLLDKFGHTGAGTIFKLLKKWLIGKPQLEIIYLPPYSPELNPIERAWWYMRKKITHNRYITTLDERIKQFWKMFSHFQKPNQELLTVCEINF